MKLWRKIKGALYFYPLSVRCRKFPESIKQVRINGLDLHYAVRGPVSGKSVVLLHGNGGSHLSLLTQAKELALAGYRVYSLESRGQGANTPLQEYHYADMAEDSYQFIRSLGLDKPAVYGWSDGGIIALMLEIAHPGTCGLIAISGANLSPDCGENFEEFKNWIIQNGTPLVMMMLSEPQIDPSELSAIKCPVLVTAGEKDVISQEHTKLIADSLPCSELEIFKGEDHGSFIKRSPKIGRSLLAFLKKHAY